MEGLINNLQLMTGAFVLDCQAQWARVAQWVR